MTMSSTLEFLNRYETCHMPFKSLLANLQHDTLLLIFLVPLISQIHVEWKFCSTKIKSINLQRKMLSGYTAAQRFRAKSGQIKVVSLGMLNNCLCSTPQAEAINNPDKFVDHDAELPLALLDQKEVGKPHLSFCLRVFQFRTQSSEFQILLISEWLLSTAHCR